MDIRKKAHIKVSNYTPSRVAVEGRRKGYMFDACNEGIPSFELMDFDEIEYINSKSPIFRNGTLRFDSDEEETIFYELKNPNYAETLLSEERIEDIVTHPTIENQTFIVGLRDMMSIERLRGCIVHLLNINDERVSARMADIINQRAREISHGIYRSNITIKNIEKKPQVTNEAYEDLMAKFELLMEQNAELAKKLEKAAVKKTTAKKTTAKPKTVEEKPAEPAE